MKIAASMLFLAALAVPACEKTDTATPDDATKPEAPATPETPETPAADAPAADAPAADAPAAETAPAP